MGVGSHEEVIGDLDESSLCAVVCSVAGLEDLIKLMVGQVLMKLHGHCSFQKLTVERKVGNRLVVVEVNRDQSRLFEDRSDGCNFEAGGNSARLQRSVDDVHQEGAEGG